MHKGITRGWTITSFAHRHSLPSGILPLKLCHHGQLKQRAQREREEDCGDSVWPSDTFRPFIPVSPNQTMQTVHGAEYTKQMGRTLFLGQNHKDHSLAAAKVQIWQNRMDQCGMGEGTSLHRLCIDLAPTTNNNSVKKGLRGGLSLSPPPPASASSQQLSGKSEEAFLLEHKSFSILNKIFWLFTKELAPPIVPIPREKGCPY